MTWTTESAHHINCDTTLRSVELLNKVISLDLDLRPPHTLTVRYTEETWDF
jgi:hypothetical protein